MYVWQYGEKEKLICVMWRCVCMAYMCMACIYYNRKWHITMAATAMAKIANNNGVICVWQQQ